MITRLKNSYLNFMLAKLEYLILTKLQLKMSLVTCSDHGSNQILIGVLSSKSSLSLKSKIGPIGLRDVKNT